MNGQLCCGSVAIRLESAEIVRDVLTRIESKEYNDALARFSKDYYVIAVVRTPPYGGTQRDWTTLWGHRGCRCLTSFL
jgi:hypothetical protein